MKKEISNEQNIIDEPSKKGKKSGKKKGRGKVILFGTFFFWAVALFSLALWYRANFNVKFNDFLFTLLSPLAGTGIRTAIDVLLHSVLPGLGALLVYNIFLRLTKEGKPVHKWLRRIGAVTVSIALVFSLVFGIYALRIPEYLAHYGEKTLIYEEEYVDPSSVAITDYDGNARNLIYIYLESFETTYASVEDGGSQKGVNYMPYLTEFAKEYVSFSDGEGLGGFHSVTGTSWTMGALLGTTSGIPFSLEIFGAQSQNKQGKDGTFLNGLTTLGDVLAEKGYKNRFLIGSEIAFAGTDSYVNVHGNYETFDLNTARERGYVSPKYHNDFWGIEDMYLYRIAKDQLKELAASGEPFNLTMMTIDAHSTGGYTCELCSNQYSDEMGNVIACCDRQLYEFVKWCQAQDFYKDTTIIITGDHPRMDTLLVEDIPYYERTVYNCIINAAIDTPVSDKNRVFTSLDMFPTTLAAIGFEIEGNRLGLGTNLFSDLPTLCEEMGEGEIGYNLFDDEVKKNSDYYKSNFFKKKNT